MSSHLEILGTLLIDLGALLFVGFVSSFVTNIIDLNIVELLSLIWNRELGHYLEKRNLVPGDLIFIDYRGSLKKATVTMNSRTSKTVQASFDEGKIVNVNIDYNNYSYSRIYVPKYLSNASKILFAVRKEK